MSDQLTFFRGALPPAPSTPPKLPLVAPSDSPSRTSLDPREPMSAVENMLTIYNWRDPEPTLWNIVVILREDPRFADRLSYNHEADWTLLDGEVLGDRSATGLNVDVASAYEIDVPTALVVEAARFVAWRAWERGGPPVAGAPSDEAKVESQ